MLCPLSRLSILRPSCASGVCAAQGLQDVIGLSVTHPTWQPTRPGEDEHCGWAFAAPGDPPLASSTGHGSFPCDACIPDSGWESTRGRGRTRGRSLIAGFCKWWGLETLPLP